MDKQKIDQVVEGCVETLRQRGLRRTRALDAVLRFMAASGKPVTLAELAQSDGLAGTDQATVYRLVMKLEEHGLVRRLGFHERATRFALLVAGEHHDYLVCTECGSIEDVDLHCPVHALEQDLMKKTGFSRVYHELEFFGICPTCAPAR